MEDARSEVKWAPRVRKEQIRRLYESDANGLLDEALVDDVGYSLYLRCRSILDVQRAREGKVACPRCQRAGQTTVIQRARKGRDELLQCPACDWQLTWNEYQKTFKRKQLNLGGALPAFSNFMQRFEAARSPHEKMLAIDRVIHEFHYSLRDKPDLPTRPTCVNLIEGDLTDVVTFLDTLTYGSHSAPETQQTKSEWRSKYDSTYWPQFIGSRAHRHHAGD